MPTYVLPQVLAFQEFSIVPALVANPLRAHISGPHAKLIRYAEADERAFGLLGYYDRLLETAYAWPERPAGGIADASYTKVWIKNALLKYYSDSISGGSVITKTTGYNNRIRSATVNFATNGDDVRHSSLYDRDVKAGDIVKVRGVNGSSESVTLWTYVRSVIGDEVASEIAAAEADADNAATQSASTTVTQTAGALNCVSVTPDGTDYDGLASGYITETYDIIVVESSVGGDYTTAKLRVISGSGEDDDTDVTPAAAGENTAIGTRGLVVVFNELDTAGCSASAVVDDVSADDLIAGQRFLVTVNQAFTEPVATSDGDYDNTVDTTYIITVSRGGTSDDSILPQIMVTTINGIDISGPTTITAVDTLVDVGVKGVQVEFDTLQLRKGDRYYIAATGTTTGPMRTIQLGHNLDTDIAAGSQVELDLFILKPLLQVEKNRTGFAPTTNWSTSDTEITINDGIIAYDETWTDEGVQLALDVYSEESKSYGQLYVEIRYWLSDLCNEVNSIQDVGEIDTAISGVLHPDNPLKWGVFKALENSNGSEVKFTSVCNPDSTDSWANVLEKLLGRDDVYGLVPLTRNRTVLDLYAAHVTAQSSPEQGLWRVLWTNLEGIPEIPVVSAGSTVPGHLEATTTDAEVALAVVEDDPDTTGSQYTRVRFTSGNVELDALGVRAGDILRLLYTSDGFGNEEYSEYVIDEVQSEDQLRLLTGPDAPISVAAKAEIWRNLTATEEAAAIAVNAGSWGSRRVRATWPDRIESSGTIQEGYFMNCSLAGLSAGVVPHQGLTHLEIVGYTDVSRTVTKFNRNQLDTMALGGVYIVTQDLTGLDTDIGQIYTRHAVTTGGYSDINAREEVITRNVDSISYRFKNHFKPFIGITNVTPVIQARLYLETGNLIRTLQTEAETANLGGQLISAEIVELRPHLTLKDRYVIKLNCVIPYPVNNIEVHLMF